MTIEVLLCLKEPNCLNFSHMICNSKQDHQDKDFKTTVIYVSKWVEALIKEPR